MLCFSGEPLTERHDDVTLGDSAIDARMQSFQQHTLPVISFYRKHGLCHNVDAQQNVDKVTEEIRKLIAQTCEEDVITIGASDLESFCNDTSSNKNHNAARYE